VSDRVHELAQVWREMIAIDHHKHKDGQFFVTKVWDYDSPKPEYYAEHHAYIGDDLYGSRHGTYAQAEVDLANHILKQIKEQEAWAKRVMADPEESDISEREAKHMLAVIERNAALIKGEQK